MTNSPKVQEIVVVTGASTGIGAATARELAKRGFHVLAGVRRASDADALRSTNLESVRRGPTLARLVALPEGPIRRKQLRLCFIAQTSPGTQGHTCRLW